MIVLWRALGRCGLVLKSKKKCSVHQKTKKEFFTSKRNGENTKKKKKKSPWWQVVASEKEVAKTALSDRRVAMTAGPIRTATESDITGQNQTQLNIYTLPLKVWGQQDFLKGFKKYLLSIKPAY